MQTYAGPALAEHVIKPAIESFNKIAGEEMEIELYFADQLVATAELFHAMQRGAIDAVQSDDDSMASPTEVTVFGGYFPFACRYSLNMGSGLQICIKFVKCHSDRGLRLGSFLRPSCLNRQRIAFRTQMRVYPELAEELLHSRQSLNTDMQS